MNIYAKQQQQHFVIAGDHTHIRWPCILITLPQQRIVARQHNSLYAKRASVPCCAAINARSSTLRRLNLKRSANARSVGIFRSKTAEQMSSCFARKTKQQNGNSSCHQLIRIYCSLIKKRTKRKESFVHSLPPSIFICMCHRTKKNFWIKYEFHYFVDSINGFNQLFCERFALDGHKKLGTGKKTKY